MRSSLARYFLSARQCMSRQTAQPLICDARKRTSSRVCGGTPGPSTAFSSICSASIAAGRTRTGLFILGCIAELLDCRSSPMRRNGGAACDTLCRGERFFATRVRWDEYACVSASFRARIGGVDDPRLHRAELIAYLARTDPPPLATVFPSTLPVLVR